MSTDVSSLAAAVPGLRRSDPHGTLRDTMLAFIGRRIAGAIPTLLIMSFIAFAMSGFTHTSAVFSIASMSASGTRPVKVT